MSNTHLHRARVQKNDLFYTRREDVEKELAHYEDQYSTASKCIAGC